MLALYMFFRWPLSAIIPSQGCSCTALISLPHCNKIINVKMKTEIISNKTPEDRVRVSNMPCIEFSLGNMSLHI